MMAALSDMGPPQVASGVVAPPDAIDAWMATAAAGEVMIYATRAFLPKAAAGAARMRALADRGLVELTQKRCLRDPSLFEYRARRTAAPSPLTRPVRAKLVLDLTPVMADEAAIVDSLLPALDRAAQYGRPCPTDRQLADKTGLSVEEVASGMLALASAGMIRMQKVAAPTLRRVTILRNGAQTGWAA